MKKVVAIIFLLFPLFAGALGPTCAIGECTLCDFFQLFADVMNEVTTVYVPIIGAILLAWGGITFYFSAGDPGKVQKGKKIITNTVIGLFIVYSAYLIVGLFLDVFGVGSGWYTIDC